MQLATVGAGKPWVCSLYYVADDNLNLYWLSLPGRRHSQEIVDNPNVSIAIAVKTDQPVIGIQAEGRAEIIKNKQIIKKVMELYVEKYNTGQNFYENFAAGKNRHEMYCFAPKSYVLFDELNFPDNPRQEIPV